MRRFRQLRWRLAVAFGLVIIVTMALGGWLSYRLTLNNFQLLVTSQGEELAVELTPLLEAIYNSEGTWEALDTPPDLDDGTQFLDEGFILWGEGYEEMWPSGDPWSQIIADELGLSPVEIFTSTDVESIAEYAEANDVDPRRIVTAIMQYEQRWVEQDPTLSEIDRIFILGSTQEFATAFIYDPFFFDDETAFETFFDEPSFLDGWLTESDQLLITDVAGKVVYDSEGDFLEETMADSLIELGQPLYSWQTSELIGYAIVAAGPGYYSSQQSAFLDGLVRSVTISGLIAAVLALVVGYLFSHRITGPVTALTAAAARIAEGQNGELLAVDTDDEIGQMSQAFNQMSMSLEAQQALRRRLVSDISHELNTPLSVIQLELEALQDGMQTPAEASIQVKREIDLLRNLVNDLDLLAEAESVDMQLSLEPLSVSELLQDVMGRWSAQAEAKSLALVMGKVDQTVGIQADKLRLNQLLSNLLSNGLRYVPAGGTITLSAQKHSSDAHVKLTGRKGQWLIITVQDDGPGIDPQDRPHIFERFYRADRSRSRAQGGRGLGLAIAKQIVQLHGGLIWVESKVGRGSIFFVALPIE